MSPLEFLFGHADRIQQAGLMSPVQQQGFESLFSNPINNNPLYGAGSSYLQQLLSNSPGAFAHFEAPFMQQFQQQIAPGIAERFAGMGTGAGALSSSGLQQALAQAGGNLQTQLAGLRGQLQMQALPQALGFSQQPYSNLIAASQIRPWENIYQPGNTGLVGSAIENFAQGAGKAAMGGF